MLTTDAAPQALVVARWLHFAAVFALFGTSLFWLALGEGGWPRSFRASMVLLRLAAMVAALSGLAWLAAMLLNMTEGVVDSDALGVFFLQTPFGPFAALRLGLLAAGLLALPLRGRALCMAMAAIGALLLVDQAWLGHAAQGGAGFRGGAMILVYCIHVLAAAAWLGGLPPLLLALVEQSDFAADAREATCSLLARYSRLALAAVMLLFVSGLANAGFRVGGAFGRLLGSEYGQLLAMKAALFASMLGLALFNPFVAMPALPARAPALRMSVTLELTLGVVVLAVTAALGVTPPP